MPGASDGCLERQSEALSNASEEVQEMLETMNRILDFSLGAVLLTKERIQRTVDECVKRGELGRTEAEKLVSELTKKGEEGRAHLGEMVRNEVGKVVDELGLATKKDLADLEARLHQ